MQAFCSPRGCRCCGCFSCFLLIYITLALAVLVPYGEASTTNSSTLKDGNNVPFSSLISWHQMGSDINGEEDGAASDPLQNQNGNNAEPFGWSIALSSDGKTIAIGTASNDGDGGGGSDGATTMNSGHARVYHYVNDTEWMQLGNDIDGTAAQDWFGFSVSLSSNGRIIAIGSPLNDHHNSSSGITTKDSGHVRIYQYTNDDDDDHDDGSSSNNNIITSNGAGSWNQLGNTISGQGEQTDLFGWAVSLSSDGDIVAIGSPSGDGGNSGYVGMYHLIEWSPSTYIWERLGHNGIIHGESPRDFFGESVSLSSNGQMVAIGIPRNDVDVSVAATTRKDDNRQTTTTTMIDSGTVRVYKFQNITTARASSSMVLSSWVPFGNDIHGKDEKSLFGKSVSLSSDGSSVAIGSGKKNRDDDTITSNVHVYKYYDYDIDTVWKQVGNDIDGENAKDLFGDLMSLSSDGNIVAIAGFQKRSSNDDGDDESVKSDNNNGRVRIFKLNDNNSNTNNTATWEQYGNIIDSSVGSENNGTNDDNHNLGYFVSLSSDGETVAVAGIKNGMNSGHVEVYQVHTPPTPLPSAVPTLLPSWNPSDTPGNLFQISSHTITTKTINDNDAMMKAIIKKNETFIIFLKIVVIFFAVVFLAAAMIAVYFYCMHLKKKKQQQKLHKHNKEIYDLGLTDLASIA